MAIPSYVASGTQTIGAGAVAPPWPAHQVGDIAFLFVETANQAAVLSDDQGFVEITGSPVGLGVGGVAASVRITVFWCRAISTSMGAPTIATTGDHIVSRISTVRNAVATGYPVHIVTSGTLLVPDTAVSVPGGTTTINDCLMLILIANSTDNATSQTSGQTNADFSSVTEVFDANTTTGVGGGICFTRAGFATAGPFGATTALLATLSTQVLMTIAVLPLAVVAVGTPNIHSLGILTMAALQDLHPIRVVPLGGT